MAISTTEARSVFTKMLLDVYKERTTPTSFLRSFFTQKESATKYVSIEVQRGTEKIAVDVIRGSEGNRNTFSKSTEKIFEPPYYREYFDATELDLYDRLFGSSMIDSGIFSQFIDTVAEKLRILQDKIERSYELQCAQVLETGIVTLTNGDNIDFKRKALSLVDKSGSAWTGSNNPLSHISAGCQWIRQNGKSQGNVFNMVAGSSALSAFFGNSFVKESANFRRIEHMSIREPQRNSVGATSHGEFSADDYIIRLWSYPEFYDNASSVSTSYVNAKKVILLPESPRFTLGFAAVPQLLDENNPVPKKGAFLIGDYKDERNHKHVFDIRSAGVAIPVAVDQIYTMQVVS